LPLPTPTLLPSTPLFRSHGKLPNVAELAAYRRKLKSLRGIPAAVKAALEELPPSAHPMDVMRTGVSVLGCVQPEAVDHNHPGARDRKSTRLNSSHVKNSY